MLCEQPLPGFPVLLQLQLHLHSGNRTQHFLLRHSLRYQQLLHNKTLHSDLLLRSIRFPVQDITVRNTEQRNRRSGWKQSLSLLHPLPRLLLFRLLCSLPQQLSLLLLLRLPHSLCLRCQSYILQAWTLPWLLSVRLQEFSFS